MNPKTVIVVPTIRERCVTEFLTAWESEFRLHTVIVVEDHPSKTFDLPNWVHHYAWADIETDLGDEAWIIPRKTGGIRSYGLLMAGRLDPDMIVMLDDDCLPDKRPGDFISGHWKALTTPCEELACYDTIAAARPGSEAIKARGYPRVIPETRTVLNHGIWNHVPDIDGVTQMQFPHYRTMFPAYYSEQVPRGAFFPMSAMNVAFTPEILPAMYQMPMGEGQPYHRFDDIWCGLVMKRACDIMGVGVRCGQPAIRHVRASDAATNAIREASGIEENDAVWEAVATMGIPNNSDINAVLYDIHQTLAKRGPYWRKVAEATAIWRRLVKAGAGVPA